MSTPKYQSVYLLANNPTPKPNMPTPATLGGNLLEVQINATDALSSLKIEEWLTTDEAASYLKVSPATLRNMTSNGHVPYFKLGKRNRYRLMDLRRLLLDQKRGAQS